MNEKELISVLEDARDMILEMGTIIRNLDEDGDASEFWNNDGDYIPGPEFKAICAALSKARGQP